jgi:hypothetical protein
MRKIMVMDEQEREKIKVTDVAKIVKWSIIEGSSKENIVQI